jgi:hypothetical protein
MFSFVPAPLMCSTGPHGPLQVAAVLTVGLHHRRTLPSTPEQALEPHSICYTRQQLNVPSAPSFKILQSYYNNYLLGSFLNTPEQFE